MPHILGRISAHLRALHGVLHCGLARGHRGNTAKGLRLERIYGAPVLLSGVAALVLSSPEVSTIHQHYKVILRQILRLPQNTPESFIMLAAGSLPATALLHLGMLTLLGMVARLGSSCILNTLGRHALLEAGNTRSWFVNLRRITEKYGLTDPLLVLQQPPTKGRWKSTCRAAVTRFWLAQYRGEAAHLTSLVHFKFNYFSLSRPHNTISTPGSPYEVSRANTVLLILSGRYISDERSRLWDPQNKEGCCRLCASPPGQPPPPGTLPGQLSPPGTITHQLLWCSALYPARISAMRLFLEFLKHRPHLSSLVSQRLKGPPEGAIAMLLDPSSCGEIIRAAQLYGPQLYKEVHYLSRVWVHSTHVLRMRLLKLRGIL